MSRHRIAFLVMLLTPTAALSAQRTWLPATAHHYAGVELGKGFFDVSSGHLGFSTMYATLLGRVALTPRVGLSVEVPFTHVDYESQGGTKRVGTKAGNPWIGVQVAPREDLTVEAGLRPAVATLTGPAAVSLGYASSADLEHWEAWYPKTTSLRGLARYGRTPEQGGFYTVMLGTTWIMPDETVGVANLLFLDYGIRGGWASEGTVASIALIGNYLVNRHGYSIEARMVNEVSAGFERSEGRVRPQASIHVYLDPSYRRGTKAAIRLGALVAF
jgi:hypothetical protein